MKKIFISILWLIDVIASSLGYAFLLIILITLIGGGKLEIRGKGDYYQCVGDCSQTTNAIKKD